MLRVGVVSFPFRKVIRSSWVFPPYQCQINFSSTTNMQWKSSRQSFISSKHYRSFLIHPQTLTIKKNNYNVGRFPTYQWAHLITTSNMDPNTCLTFFVCTNFTKLINSMYQTLFLVLKELFKKNVKWLLAGLDWLRLQKKDVFR